MGLPFLDQLGDVLKRGHEPPSLSRKRACVDDVRAAVAELAAGGAELIDNEPRQGMFGLEVAFVHPESVHGVLSELVSGD